MLNWGGLCLALVSVFQAPLLRAQGEIPAPPDPVGGVPTGLDPYNAMAETFPIFVRYTKWPADRQPTAEKPLVIGVLGEDPFGDRLSKALSGQSFGTVPTVLRRYMDVASAAAECHVVFIGSANRAHLSEWLPVLSKKPILTIGEDDEFLALNGIIRFRTLETRIVFEVNQKAVEATGLSLRSELFVHASRVYGAPLENKP